MKVEQIGAATLYLSDVMEGLGKIEDGSVQTCITSPPYWGLRDYGQDGQIGLEATYPEYVEKLRAVFRDVWRTLKDDGTLWLNLGDCYATGGGAVGSSPGGGEQGERALRQGHVNTQPNRMPQPGLKAKDLAGIPWRVAFALQDDGWFLRCDIIWSKPNPMPESVRDRPTRAHEYIFLMSKSKRYFYDYEAIQEPLAAGSKSRSGNKERKFIGTKGVSSVLREGSTRNRRTVWNVATRPSPDAHFATFPIELIEPCVLAGAPPGAIVLDPFVGSGTTGAVALSNGRRFVGIELNPEYLAMAARRCDEAQKQQRLFN